MAEPSLSRATSRVGFLPYAVLTAAVLALSAGSIMAKAADAPSAVIATYRVGVAFLVLAPVVLAVAYRELCGLTRLDVARTALAGLFLALHFLFWIESLMQTTVANSVLLANTSPIWIALLGVTLGTIKPTKTLAVSILACMTGAALVAWGGLSVDQSNLHGDGLAVLAGMALAGYLLCGSKARVTMSAPVYMLLTYASGACILLVFTVIQGVPLSGYSGWTLVFLLATGLLSQLIGHGGPSWALKVLTPGFVSLFLLADLVVSPLLALAIFAEPLTPLTILGCVVILGGLWIASREALM